jgi:hypothetical protein
MFSCCKRHKAKDIIIMQQDSIENKIAELRLTLAGLIGELRTTRDNYSKRAIEMSNLRTAFEITEEYKEASYLLNKALDNKIYLEAKVREIGVEIYNLTQDKDVYNNLVRERDITDFNYDYDAMLEWCVDRKIFLKLDESTLKKYLRTVSKNLPKGVTIEVKPQIIVASDLTSI